MKMSARIIQSQILRLWKKLLEHDPTCSEFGNIVKNIPSLREGAAKELLLRDDIKNEDLLCLMRYCEEVRIAAWDRFVLRNPSDIELRYVIENVLPLAEVAGKMLLDRFPAKNFLFCIMERVSSLRGEESEQYRDQFPTHDELCWVIRYISPLRSEAATMLLLGSPRNADLRCIAVRVPSLAVEAATMLLRRNPSKDDIQQVLATVPELKEEAARMLTRQASETELRELMAEHESGISESAGKEFYRRTTKLSVADKKYIQTNVPSLKVEIERREDKRIRAQILDVLLNLGHTVP